ncbi:unnamed protein product [Fraxinus pennsylvanica]|uniref:Reverse transcriptase zinc-binding domain-containing protein n=1 Tax=Fraxinus pennsylvanica TaxID=56036 RepID=A0AAD2A206_9LAMI|nr:unnamed protein product [Fraxinus pennsylvanica]
MRDTLDTFRPDSTREDVLRWVDDVHGVFSVRNAWESIRLRFPSVTWYHIVWFPKYIPRHAFILWLAIQGGLYTQTKLFCFGLVQYIRCVLCGCSEEDLDHLFFACPFSERVWPVLGSTELVTELGRYSFLEGAASWEGIADNFLFLKSCACVLDRNGVHADISIATTVAEGTIKNAYKDLYPHAAKIIPDWYAKERDLKNLSSPKS